MRIRRKPDHDSSAYVYRHIRMDTNQVFYIGIGVGYYGQRALQKTKRSRFWHHITDKTQWYAEIILDGLTREQAEEKEKEFIALYKRKKDGGTLCNITFGGDGSFGLRGEESPNYGKKHTPERIKNMRQGQKLSITEELKNRLSKAAKMRPPVTDATKAKLKAVAIKGAAHPNFGKPLPDSTKKKLSIAHKGKKMSQSTKDKISEFQKGKVVSAATVFKMKGAAKLRWEKRKDNLPYSPLNTIKGHPKTNKS